MALLEYTIGPKREGNYRIPIDMKIIFDNQEELGLNLFLTLKKTYSFSNSDSKLGFYLGGGTAASYKAGPYCKWRDKIEINWDNLCVFKALRLGNNYHENNLRIEPLTINLISFFCDNCQKMKECKIYVGWTKFNDNIYSEIEDLILEIASDVKKAWDEAIDKARQAVYLEEKKISVELSSEMKSMSISKNDENQKKIVSRKIKVQ